MFDTIKNLFKASPKINYGELIKEGAVILDVRSRAEFESGHIKGAINIPVDELRGNLKMLGDKNKTIITCCASGMRSESAKSILISTGYSRVYNGGGWYSLNSKL